MYGLGLSLLLVLVTLSSVLQLSDGYRVLMFSAMGGKSQKNVFYGLGKGLVERGHEVVFFNNFKPTSPVPGIKELVPEALAEVFADEGFPNTFEVRASGMMNLFGFIERVMGNGTRMAMRSKEVAEILEQKWDVIVFGVFSNPHFYMAQRLNVPFVVMIPVSSFFTYTAAIGSPTLPSLVPIPLPGVEWSAQLTFLERCKNMLGHGLLWSVHNFILLPFSDRVAMEMFGEGVVPPAAEMEKNISMVMLNGNPIMDHSFPLLPNSIQVGGLHCDDPKPLPKDMKDFLGDSDFIFFSLGSVVKPRDIPADKKKILLNVLGSLPYKVLIKWVSADRTKLPENMFPSTWLPQQDILGHPRLQVFITHGGYASVQESVCHGIPMLALPVHGDQDANAAAAVQAGHAVSIKWEEMTEYTFRQALVRSLDPQLKENVRQKQRLMRGIPVRPRDLAVHHVEQVALHRGADHLRSAGHHMGFIQYYSLDVLAFFTVILALMALLVCFTCGMCFRCLCRRKAAVVEVTKPVDSETLRRKKRNKYD